MDRYISTFNSLCKQDPPEYYPYKLWREIDLNAPSIKYQALCAIQDFFNASIESSISLVGQCYNVIPAVSLMLIQKGIPHTITIGEVELDGKPYFGATEASIQRELDIGYRDDLPIDSHVWITLECGEILDLTILASIANKVGNDAPAVSESVYVSDGYSGPYVIEHIPLSVGPDYIVRVTTPPNEIAWQDSAMWIEMMTSLLATPPTAKQ